MSRRDFKPRLTFILTAALLLSSGAALAAPDSPAALKTATPVKHLVVLFHENVSFDHYFATYPVANRAVDQCCRL